MKHILRYSCLLLTLVLALPLVSCAASREVRADGIATRAVATAGNIEIPYEDLYFLAMNEIYDLKLAHGEDAMNDPANQQTLRDFIAASLPSRHHAFLSIAVDYGVDIESGSVGKNVDAYMEDVLETTFDNDRDKYIESLAAEYLTDHYVRTFVAVEDFLSEAIILEMIERGELNTSDEYARERIEKDMIRTKHVFIDRTNPLYTEEEHRAHAAELQAAIAAKTSPAARLDAMNDAIGGKYNNDYDDTAGYGYYFVRGEHDAAYEDAAFALQNDYDVSNVVETDEGWYIIMRFPKDEAYVNDPKNFEVLKTSAYLVQLNTKIDARLGELKASYAMTEFGNSLDLFDLPAINPKGGEAIPVITAVIVVVAVGGTVGYISYRSALKKRKK